ncbi:Hypothetical predicted protein, partial [Olea europaea subsp. europaea]
MSLQYIVEQLISVSKSFRRCDWRSEPQEFLAQVDCEVEPGCDASSGEDDMHAESGLAQGSNGNVQHRKFLNSKMQRRLSSQHFSAQTGWRRKAMRNWDFAGKGAI